MRRGIVLGIIVAFGTLSLTVAGYQGQGQQGKPKIKKPGISKLKENLYIIAGSMPEYPDEFTGGNTLAWITDKGVVVVDTKNPGWGQMILDKIQTVTNKPVMMVLNSHGHSDHAGSNPEFGPTVEYIVHENIK